jgi:hypothetical protein
MNSSQIRNTLIFALAICVALYLGIAAATAQFEALAWVSAGLFVVFCLALGKHIWVIIPSLMVQGNINALPGTPPPWALAAAVVAGMYLIRFATRRHDFVFRWNWLDFAILLQILAVAQTWVRNPTGLLILGGDTAGGKPYFVFAAVALAFACLSITRPTVKVIRWTVIAMVTIGVLDGIVLMLNDYVPAFAEACIRVYGGNIGAAMSGQALNIEDTRGGFGMGILGKNLLLPLFCILPTIRCINPLRIIPFTLTLLGSALIFLSGFRSGVVYFVVIFTWAAIIRRRYLDIVIAAFLATLGIIAVLTSGNLDKLPYGAQRILTVVGANVRADVQSSADDSSDDRFEVWRIVLTSNQYIRNKWLGDGFSLSAREQKAILDSAITGFNTRMGLDSFKERCLATGSYHGFHVETIRHTGVFGLACAIIAMVIFFHKGTVLIRHFRGQPIFGFVLYLCLPVMVYLFWSLLVFGSYRVDYPPILIMAGMLKLLDNLRLSQIAELASQSMVANDDSKKGYLIHAVSPPHRS